MFSKDIYQKALQLGIDLIAPCNKLTEGKKLLDKINNDALPITISDEKKKLFLIALESISFLLTRDQHYLHYVPLFSGQQNNVRLLRLLV